MSDFRLKVFSKVKKHLNFTKAAEALFITQPAVSKHINSLEEELGVSLFFRTKHGTELTPEGRIYAEYADEILSLYREAKFKMDETRLKFGGSLKIGASTTVAQYFLPELIAGFLYKNPNLEISLFSGNTEEIENLILKKTVDIGFIEGLSGKPQLRYKSVAQDELVAVAKPDHPLASVEQCTLAQLLRYPWALRESGSGSLDILLAELEKKGVSRKDLLPGITLGSTESIKSFVKFSEFVGFVSIFSVKEDLLNGKLKIIDISDFEVTRNFSSAELSGVSQGLAKLFIDYVIDSLKL